MASGKNQKTKKFNLTFYGGDDSLTRLNLNLSTFLESFGKLSYNISNSM
jgi:hypothetical protein